MVAHKLKIVYVVNSLNLGGTENLVVQMSLAFKSEYDMYVFCLDQPGLWAEKLRKTGIPVYGLGRQPGLDVAVAGKIARFCRKFNIDILHAHQCTAWFYSALSRILYSKTKLLFEEHGRHYPEVYSWKRNTVNKWVIQHITHSIVAVSSDTGKRLVQYEGVSPDKIEVIYNGVSAPPIITEGERETLRHSFGITPHDFVIGSVGRLDPIKNYPMLLKAFSKLDQKVQEKSLLMLVGDGPESDTLREQSRRLGIADRCIFTGYREDAVRLLQCFNLFVLCSFSEGTSMAILEAMATFVPAIVTKVGGNTDLVIDKQTGRVVDSENIEELRCAIEQGRRQYNKAKQYALSANERFNKYFTFDAMLDSYRKQYRKLSRD